MQMLASPPRLRGLTGGGMLIESICMVAIIADRRHVVRFVPIEDRQSETA
jgi:hypothetical protein